MLRAGHTIASYTWADINPDAHTATSHRLFSLQKRHPEQLPSSALVGWDRRLPFYFNCISLASLESFPEGIDVIIAGPPFQPFLDAGRHKGTKDPRRKALIQVTRLIEHIERTQPNGIGYIIEDVPGTEKHPAVKELLGHPLHLERCACLRLRDPT
jgi:site-specific DNA-cytosine methylase